MWRVYIYSVYIEREREGRSLYAQVKFTITINENCLIGVSQVASVRDVS